MKSIIFNATMSHEIIKACELAGYGRGYSKRIAERVLLDAKDVALNDGESETYNNALFGADTDTDLVEHTSIKDVLRAKPSIKINEDGYIEFDIWIYQGRAEDWEVASWLSVYMMAYGKDIKTVLNRPCKSDYLRFVILAKAGKLTN